MRVALARWLCSVGWHDPEVVDRDGGVFNRISGDRLEQMYVSGDVERCVRPWCRKFMFTSHLTAYRLDDRKKAS